VKTSIFDSTRIKQAPTSFSSLGTARPKQEKKSFQPLKAFAPIASTAPSNITNPGNGKRLKCPSAPVTRKFMAPEPVNRSPSMSKVQTTPRRNSVSSQTPSKSTGRPSFANVRSSGYGPQASSCTKNTRVREKFVNSTTLRYKLIFTITSRQSLQVRLLQPLNESCLHRSIRIVILLEIGYSSLQKRMNRLKEKITL